MLYIVKKMFAQRIIEIELIIIEKEGNQEKIEKSRKNTCSKDNDDTVDTKHDRITIRTITFDIR